MERARLHEADLVERFGRFTIHSLRHFFAAKLLLGGFSLY